MNPESTKRVANLQHGENDQVRSISREAVASPSETTRGGRFCNCFQSVIGYDVENIFPQGSFMKRWSVLYEVCLICGKADSPHMAKGKCRRCYLAEYRSDPVNAERIALAKSKHYLEKIKPIQKRIREDLYFGGKREAVLQRDGYKCCMCSSGDMLVVHHKDHSGRGAKTHNNSMENLETLCRACHQRIHFTLNRWAKDYDKCRICGLTDKPHNAFGFCTRCYWKAEDGKI
jgi:5-methylcytosine-specific restriction endonuclease McrA